MTKSILTIFSNYCPSFIGSNQECFQLQKSIKKWSEVDTNVLELFDSGLNYADNTFLLMFENDEKVELEVEKLFNKTKLKGKTDKTIYLKIKYLQNNLAKIFIDNSQRLIKEHNIEYDLIRNDRYPDAVINTYINYYFSEFDKELNFNKLELYPLEERGLEVIKNVNFLEKNNKNKTKPKLNLFPTSKTELNINIHQNCVLKFYWDDMDNYEACKLMGEVAPRKYEWQQQNKIYAELESKLKNCRIDVMDTDTNLYGQTNNWFYINFYWKPQYFKYSEVIKAEKLVNELIYRKIKGKKFKPNDVHAIKNY